MDPYRQRWGLEAVFAEVDAWERQKLDHDGGNGGCCFCRNGASAYYSKTDRADYAKYPVVLNLPGSTTAHYSRNLNHLWATGAAVVTWNRTPPPREPTADGAPSSADATTLFREWYYAGLTDGETHVEVGSPEELRVAVNELLRRDSQQAKERRQRLRLARGATSQERARSATAAGTS